MPKHPSHILALAKRGAEHRHQELKAEIESLVKLFPHLRSVRSVRRIVLHFPRSHPDTVTWARLACALSAAPA
jgi:hypothetical protein